MRDLSELRAQINEIDSGILELFQRRMQVVAEVAEYKRAAGKPVYDRERERENVRRAAEAVPPELSGYAAILESILMEAARASEYRQLGSGNDDATQSLRNALAHPLDALPSQARVACQGVEGAYQQIAADRLFVRPDLVFFNTFEEVFRAIEDGTCPYAVLPVENSAVGSITRVYDLMTRHSFHIVRSCRLRIEHNLLVPPGSRLEDVRVVYSHEQAIAQCAGYLAHLPHCRVEICGNTAQAAEMVAHSGRTDIAALASSECARLYGLDIAQASVQDHPNNFTRFVCVTRDLSIISGADRSTLAVLLSHEPGSLFKLLARLYALDFNLLKLESRPIPDRDFESLFYLDIQCPVASPRFLTLMESLDDVCEQYRYLGSYAEVL